MPFPRIEFFSIKIFNNCVENKWKIINLNLPTLLYSSGPGTNLLICFMYVTAILLACMSLAENLCHTQPWPHIRHVKLKIKMQRDVMIKIVLVYSRFPKRYLIRGP
jgi:hypothetical protein